MAFWYLVPVAQGIIQGRILGVIRIFNLIEGILLLHGRLLAENFFDSDPPSIGRLSSGLDLVKDVGNLAFQLFMLPDNFQIAFFCHNW